MLTRLTTIIFCLKIDFIVVVVVETTIVDIVVDKFDFVMTNMCFISVAIDTRCTTFKFKKILKVKNKRSAESLNENCIHQKLNSYEIAKN